MTENALCFPTYGHFHTRKVEIFNSRMGHFTIYTAFSLSVACSLYLIWECKHVAYIYWIINYLYELLIFVSTYVFCKHKTLSLYSLFVYLLLFCYIKVIFCFLYLLPFFSFSGETSTKYQCCVVQKLNSCCLFCYLL